ncbi:MAG: hypothetical protein ABI601_00320 [bacterium]
MDERSYESLQETVLARVRTHAVELALRWETQIKHVAHMDDVSATEPADAESARRLTWVLLGSATSEDHASDEVVAAGLKFGSDAFIRGSSLHYTMKALDLLAAMTLYAAETAVAETESGGLNAAQGIRLARYLQRRAALLSLAATRGYAQAYSEALRERFRHLRHDLRNPLGTIKSVLALMNDESVPLDARADPRFQAMARRNARSLEELIADRLSDAVALLPIAADQEVSLRSVACAVRRELRSDTERKGITILVETTVPSGRIDAPGLELLLREVLRAIIKECVEGDQLHLEFSGPVDDRGTVSIGCESGREPIQERSALERLGSLAERIGASVATGQRVLVSVPMAALSGGERPAAAAQELERSVERPVTLGDRESRDDLRSPRQRNHG